MAVYTQTNMSQVRLCVDASNLHANSELAGQYPAVYRKKMNQLFLILNQEDAQ